jgi:hypothetical protein
MIAIKDVFDLRKDIKKKEEVRIASRTWVPYRTKIVKNCG